MYRRAWAWKVSLFSGEIQWGSLLQSYCLAGALFSRADGCLLDPPGPQRRTAVPSWRNRSDEAYAQLRPPPATSLIMGHT